MELTLYHLSNEQRDFVKNQYIHYYDKICQFIRSKGLNNDEVEQIASDVFMKAIENLSTFQDRGNSFGSWIYKIASNEVSQTFRNHKKLRFDELTENELFIEENISLSIEMSQDLVKALKRLSEKQLVIIKLRYFQKLSFKEIGMYLSISESNAKVKCFRALEKLRFIFFSIDQLN